MEGQPVESVQNRQQLQWVTIETDSHRTIHMTIKLCQLVPWQILERRIDQIEQMQRKDSLKAIWIHLNSFNLSYIQSLLLRNYIIHRGVKDSVSLYKWTSHLKDNIPQYSRFYIGCGAAIIKDNHIFLVQEKETEKGFSDCQVEEPIQGELISLATQRQLFEQTGIKGKSQYVIYFRQLPRSLWGASDIYFVSYVAVDAQQFQKINLCESQISQFKWVHLNQYEQFISKNGFGSQVHVSKRISELYRKGYDFKLKSNFTTQKLYMPNRTNIMVEHLVTGVSLLEEQD